MRQGEWGAIRALAMEKALRLASLAGPAGADIAKELERLEKGSKEFGSLRWASPGGPQAVAYWSRSSQNADALARELAGKRVLEVFAGNGALGFELAKRGVDIACASVLSSMDGHERGLLYPVLRLEASEAVRLIGSEFDALLMSWPVADSGARMALRAWGKGRPAVFVGEATDYGKGFLGGCADDEFFMEFAARKISGYRGKCGECALVGHWDPQAGQTERKRRLGL